MWCAVVAALIASGAQVGYLWTFDALNAKADIVVIAEPVRTVDTGRRGEHPELTPPLPVIEWRTDLKVLSVIKAGADGAVRAGAEIRLRHLSIDVDEWRRQHPAQKGQPPPGLINAGTALSFDARTPVYLLYLKRLADGAYEAVSGATFPTDSVLNLVPTAKQMTAWADELLPAVASELRAVQDEDMTSGPIPVRARQLLPAFRRELAARVLRSLNAAPDVPIDLIDARARADLDAALSAAMSETASGPYGGWVDVKVRPVPGMVDTVIAAIRIGIKCGDDASLHVFKRSFGRWRAGATLASRPSASIGAAWGRLEYAVQADGHGGFTLVVAEVNPWCSSNWQALRYRVYHASSSGVRLVFADRRTIYLGVDEPVFTIRLDRRQFELAFTAASQIEPGMTDQHLIVYDISGAHVTRVRESPARR
jgi:hypothetical protein